VPGPPVFGDTYSLLGWRLNDGITDKACGRVAASVPLVMETTATSSGGEEGDGIPSAPPIGDAPGCVELVVICDGVEVVPATEVVVVI
jgi:hypothetical protein